MSNIKHVFALSFFMACQSAPLPLCRWQLSVCHAQQISQNYVTYIERYSPLAIDQMQRYNIPASITIAQAIVESGAGKSLLAQKANNHFGIKKGVGWNGPTMPFDDDKPNELFRVYSNVAESYEDHSKFLQQPRYKRLYNLAKNDYKGWAKGLSACGYATDPRYANNLIKLIEQYNLAQYDNAKHGGTWVNPNDDNKKTKKYKKENNYSRMISEVNGIPCVVVIQGDTWSRISQQTGVSIKKLLQYNEVTINYVLKPGTNIFLAKKAKKAEKAYKHYWHRIKKNESMHDISQQFGIRLKYLYKMNYRKSDYQAQEGDLLKVR